MQPLCIKKIRESICWPDISSVLGCAQQLLFVLCSGEIECSDNQRFSIKASLIEDEWF
jgi:hypothetical protein